MKRAQARRLSRVANAVALLFLGMATGSKVLTGNWPFDGAIELAVACVAAGAVFQIAGMRRFSALPDPSSLLNDAIYLASNGRIDRAISVLGKTIGENPALWQAYQYRGELYLSLGNNTSALRDFDEAIRLTPGEPHLYELRRRATAPDDAISGCGTIPEIRDSEVK